MKEVLKDLYLLRIDDKEIKYFESLWEIPEGITYNAYLLKTAEGAVLFDTWKNNYSKEFLEVLNKIIDTGELKYIVVHHMEPDHSGSLPAILERNKDITVVGHPLSLNMIKSFYGVNPGFKPIKDNEELAIGGYRLRFIYTPWLHWPETIMTFIEDAGLLLSCDAFGAYSLPRVVYSDEMGDREYSKYIRYARKYFATVIGFYRGFVLKNLDKLSSTMEKISMIAPSHGVIWRRNLEIISYYRKWAWGEPSGKAVIIYASMYGFVDEAIKHVTEVLRERGISPIIYRFIDNDRSLVAEAIGDALDADLLVIGAATYEAGVFPLMNYIVDLIVEKVPSNKDVVIVSSYGWGGAAGRILSKKLSDKGFRVKAIIEYRGRLTDKEIEKIHSIL